MRIAVICQSIEMQLQVSLQRGVRFQQCNHEFWYYNSPGMPYGFVRIFYFVFIYFSCFLFFRRQGFRMITFDRQGGPFQNICRSRVMVIGRSVSFSDPARPPGGGVGRPKHPKISPSNFLCVLGPQEHFLAKIIFFS